MSHHHHDVPLRVLGWCGVLQIVGLVAEMIGGYATHSLALVSDAWHMAADVAPVMTTWLVRYHIQLRRRNGSDQDFGLGVAVSGRFNAVTLGLAGMIAIAEASPSVQIENRVVAFWPALLIAAAGGWINWKSHRLLARAAAEACEHDSRFDIRALRAHFHLDLWGSIVAVAALVLTAAYSQPWWDTAGGVVIALWMVLYSAWLLMPMRWRTWLVR